MTAELVEQYTTVDKSEWPRGPWDHEPDKGVWVDETTGLDCMIVRGPSGALCGYVGVPAGHPAYGHHDSDRDFNAEWITAEREAGREVDIMDDNYWVPVPDVHELLEARCHGGLTFAGPCSPVEGDPSVGICHIPQEGRSDDVWWFGFDCAHSGDVTPKFINLVPEDHRAVVDESTGNRVFVGNKDPLWRETYKSWDYVVDEVTGLAAQFAELTAEGGDTDGN